MIDSLLIANRGEIARRILRTARGLGVRTIAVHSDADRHMPFVREADEAVAIGPAPGRESYLVGSRILEAARLTGAAAIHPGYGFLSENADFAEAVREAGLIWVGAPPTAIRAMGLKDAAKRLMQAAGVPVTPGYLGDDQSPTQLKAEADAIGYPVLIKAVAGGGGKGMRRVDDPSAFIEALASCQREAVASFSDDRVLLEKYVLRPRHIEVQIFGDTHGQIVHLFERDCSLQRRHQKVIEEAPAPGVEERTRDAICAAAVAAGKAVGYVGAGTVEFIADASEGLHADRIWFMEMNTRLQVEHPVTEAITEQDLVEWQLRVAAGEPLPKTQDELTINGWAIEARLYAENPLTGFLPSIGRLDHLRLPRDIRVDAGVEEGDEISAHYDPMIAKLIVHASNRELGATKLAAACRKIEVWPVKTNAAFLARCASDVEFIAGRIDTGFIERRAESLIPDPTPGAEIIRAAAQALLPNDSRDPWTALVGFRASADIESRVAVDVAGTTYLVATGGAQGLVARSIVSLANGDTILFDGGQAWPFGTPRADRSGGPGGSSDGALLSPMPGRVIAIEVSLGDPVTRGKRLLILEAMKMEQALVAPFDGVVAELKTEVGAQVGEGVLLARIEKAEP
jgi:3-methylcrotonyl-CoA carboxylase alpha subunit